MRVATLTWYTGNNYGSTMQAYALQKTLKKLGHTTEVLAYTPGKVKNWRLKFRNHSVKATIDYKINEIYVKIKSRGDHASRSNMQLFDLFRERYMQFSAPVSSDVQLRKAAETYDALICGSDQIWSPFYFDPTYALDFSRDEKKIAYAPSFGVNRVPERSKKWMSEPIRRIPYVSVREANGAEIVQELTGKSAQVVVDPTLLLSREEWAEIAADVPEDKPFIVCYFLRKNELYHRYVQELAKKLDCEIRLIPMVSHDFQRCYTIQEAVGPREWIGLIKKARWVVTDSFHCTVFSIIFQKDFSVFRAFANQDERSQNSRIDSLLKIAGLTDRVVGKETDVHINSISVSQWADTQTAVNQYANQSLQWLEHALKDIERKNKVEITAKKGNNHEDGV